MCHSALMISNVLNISGFTTKQKKYYNLNIFQSNLNIPVILWYSWLSELATPYINNTGSVQSDETSVCVTGTIHGDFVNEINSVWWALQRSSISWSLSCHDDASSASSAATSWGSLSIASDCRSEKSWNKTQMMLTHWPLGDLNKILDT